ncbi:MAG: hypothetical protein D6758_08920, partial [Gammaproteobacteria bacterium]
AALMLALSTGLAAADRLSEARKLILRKQYGQAVELLTQEARQGQPEACWMLSALYRKGQGVARSPGQAFHYLRCAAEGGKVTAMRGVGLALLAGDGIRKNVVEARQWLERAARAGDTVAAERLASVDQPDWPDDYSALVKVLKATPAEQISTLPPERRKKVSRAGESLLWPFVREHDWVRAGQLLGLGLEIDRSRQDGRTLLHDRVLASDWEAVRWLLRHHARAARPDAQGNTALHLAVMQSKTVELPELISAGALNVANRAGETPLDVAVAANRASWIKALRQAGGQRRKNGLNEAQYAEKALADQARQAGLPALHYAAQTGALAWLKRQSPKSWQDKDPKGMTPLMRAIEGEQWQTASWLTQHLTTLQLDEVRWIDKVLAAGEIPLAKQMIARLPDERAALHVLELALKLRAEAVYAALMKQISLQGASPRLLLAAARGHAWEAVRQWVRYAQPVQFDAQHRHALWYALAAGKRDISELLMEAGQRPLVRDLFGETGLHAWVQQGMPGDNGLLHLPGVSVDGVNAGGQTLLMTAVLAHHPDAVKRLLEAGADVHARDDQGNTALILAAREQRVDIVRLLLNAGAKPGQRNRNKHSALNIAEQLGNEEIVRLLREADKKGGWF